MSRNEIEAHTLTEEQFEAQEGVQNVYVNLNDSLEIVGYRLAKKTFKKRKAKLRWSFSIGEEDPVEGVHGLYAYRSQARLIEFTGTTTS